VQGLVDLGLFSVGYGDQDFGQVAGGAELQGIAPDQAIGRLVVNWEFSESARSERRESNKRINRTTVYFPLSRSRSFFTINSAYHDGQLSSL